MAERLGVDAVTIHRYEKGQAKPRRPEVIGGLRDVLGFSQAELDALFLDWTILDGIGHSEYAMQGYAFLELAGMEEHDLVERLIEIDTALIPDIVELDEGTTDQWAPIFHDSPWTWQVLVHHGRIVGYWHYLILTKDSFAAVMRGSLRDSMLAVEHLDTPIAITGHGAYFAYIVMAGIEPAHRNPATLKMLFQSLIKSLCRVAEHGIFFAAVGTVAVTPEGSSIAQRLGMKPVCAIPFGRRVEPVHCMQITADALAGGSVSLCDEKIVEYYRNWLDRNR
ncbi:transcriptional regulator with XRE-family HTH domain [Rhodovulum sulfidophilum]|nr:hypothetical protein A6W98_04820 [Rhodovulum sulfidophilum DSM 1374]ANB37273.1 hypothetical protein A6024_04670 [Rhodovulum sulfidophilum]MCW2305433.1 transcriptional regulator with XRE-family HTH domain [Rhodovulum sulfidophilum]